MNKVDSNFCSLLVPQHAIFIHELRKKKESLRYYIAQHLQMNAVYWSLGALHILKRLNEIERSVIISFVKSCWNENDGGYGGNSGLDSHMLYTLSAVQILCILEAEDEINKDAVGKWVAERQKEDGSFEGDAWGEIDTRFCYCAFNCLALINKLDLIDIEKTVNYISICQNWDGGFGVAPNAESHAGQIFCCLGTLRIANALDKYDFKRLSFWLSSRQLQESGGLNGRPEKKADVCYSWWVISSLSILEKLNWINRLNLFEYILLCQDEEGGIADKPGNQPDVYHTFFGIAGLSLLGYNVEVLNRINPVYAMPYETLERLGITTEMGKDVGRFLPKFED